MLGKDDVGRLLDYTIWANHRVMRASATLSVDDLSATWVRATAASVAPSLT